MKILITKVHSPLAKLFSTKIPTHFLPRHGLPFPPLVHAVIGRSEIERYRQILVIGDVHGCADELTSLLVKAEADDADTLKVFVGDMINKGPDSVGVLRMLRRMPHRAVRGNNEEAALREHRRRIANPDYRIPASYRWVENLEPADIDYMYALPYTLEIPDLNSMIVHAGLVPGRPLSAQRPADMVTMRNIRKDDASREWLTTNKTDVGLAWAPLWCGPRHVYFGHDASRLLQLYEFATGLDTACVYGNHLTGVFIAGKRRGELVSVPARKTYKEWE